MIEVRDMKRGTCQHPARPYRARMRRAAVAVTGVLLLAGCGYQAFGTQEEQPAASAPPTEAASANSECVQATPVVSDALGVIRQLQRGSMTAADAQRQLRAGQTALGGLARATTQPVLQAYLAQTFDALTVFRAVMLNPGLPSYQQVFANLAGTLAGFARVCSVGTPASVTGAGGWAAVPVTLKGSVQVGLWAHAVSGTPTLTLQVSEVSGSSVLGTQQVTMQLDQTSRFGSLTYRVGHPGASSLRVTVSAAGQAPGKAFLVNDITVVRS
jgi:hypothetical protein